MDEVRVSRFEHAGDVREVSVGMDGGRVVVREEVSGPSARIAYGEERRLMSVFLSGEAVSRLLGEVGFAGGEGSLWDYLSSEGRSLVDLMDLCDERGIAYEFRSSGSGGDCCLRPAGVA